MNSIIIYNNIPCPVLLKKEPNTFLIFFNNEQKWIFKCSLGYGEIKKDQYGTHYYFNKYLHREDGPAIEWYDGGKQWYQNGELHRLDEPAVETNNGSKSWYQNGLRHRLDGPAVEYSDGEKEWYQNGNLHRLDGPAIEYAGVYRRWFIEGSEYSEEQYNKKLLETK